MTAGHLQIVVCGAGPAADVTQLVRVAQEQPWTVAVTATPSAMDFIEPQTIESLTAIRSARPTSHRPAPVGRFPPPTP